MATMDGPNDLDDSSRWQRLVLFTGRKQEQKLPVQTLLAGLQLMHMQATNMHM